eukprot:130806-Chlamydomonas_euryale.AAC.12
MAMGVVVIVKYLAPENREQHFAWAGGGRGGRGHLAGEMGRRCPDTPLARNTSDHGSVGARLRPARTSRVFKGLCRWA